MSGYRFTLEAENDLRNIARYTLEKWGLEQTKRYESQLADCFHKIAQGKAISKQAIPHRPDLLHARCEHHYIFYRINGTDTPLILAVSHERMDLMTRLKDRL